MKKILLSILTLMFLSVAAAPSLANDSHHPQNVLPKSYTAKGEVIAIDTGAGKIKLKHEAVPELEWPAMTMFFPVIDKALLDGIAVGNQVEFMFVNINTGPTITQIKPVK